MLPHAPHHLHPAAWVLLVAYLTHLRDTRGVAARTRADVLGICRRFFEHLGPGRHPALATAADYRTFVAGRAPTTAELYGGTVLRCYRWATDEGLLERNPLARLRAPKAHPGPPRDLTTEQVAALLDAAAGVDPRLLIGMLLQFGAGLRRAEVVGARVEDCCLRHVDPAIRVRGKGNRVRVVPLTAPGLAAVVRDWVGERTHGPVLPNSVHPGEGICPQHYSALFRRARDAAGLSSVTSHQLRHTFATVLMQAGCVLGVVQRLLGHASVAVTERYTSGWSPDVFEAAGRHPMLTSLGPGRVGPVDRSRPRVGRPADNRPRQSAAQPAMVVVRRVKLSRRRRRR